MIALEALALLVALGCALAAVAFGQVLTRAVVASHAAVAAFGLACLVAGGGVLALCFAIVGLVSLAILQLFGWMLVDVDHDHLPPPALRTTAARALALALVAGALVALGRRALRGGELGAVASSPEAGGRVVDPAAIGAFFLGSGSEVALILGLLLAAGLLTSLCLLHDEGADAG